MRRLLVFGTVCMLLMCTSDAWPSTINERFENYLPKPLVGQSGWYLDSGTGNATIVSANGPTMIGSRCVQLDNSTGGGVKVCRNVMDLAATYKFLTVQYDVRNVTNNSGCSPSTFQFRISDQTISRPAVDVMHRDSGSGPGCQAWANDGDADAWAPGGPTWSDTNWHTVQWRFNYDTRELVYVSLDGVKCTQRGWGFVSWPGYATHANRLELILAGPDGGNDVWQLDNVIVWMTTAPSLPVSVASAKAMADGTQAQIRGVVTAVFGDDSIPRFYIQDASNLPGIQVRYSGTLPLMGDDILAGGVMATDSTTNERYLDVTSGLTVESAGSVKPRGITTRSLGGGAQGLQQAVYQGRGINNVGSVVKLAGKVTGVASDRSYFYVSDGCDLDDGNSDGFHGVRIDSSYVRPALCVGDRVVVTGISSMYASSGNCHRTIRTRDIEDITNFDDRGDGPKLFKVLVLNFDPYVPSQKMLTHEAFGWTDPHILARDYANDLRNCSGCWAQFKIAEWVDATSYTIFLDGFQYTADDYYTAWSTRVDVHSGDVNYYQMIGYYGVDAKIASGEVDEVWLFGPPALGWNEAAMAGPSPYFINGATCYYPQAGRNFAIMGFNYERGVDCMLEDFCHRTECVLSRVYGPPQWWFPTYPCNNNWDRFRMIDRTQSGEAACGFCHYSPNSTGDYDWGNTTYVWSTCDDWLYNWPNLQGTKKWVNCSEWGNGDCRSHHKWWLNHMPKTPGVWPGTLGSTKDAGKQNNWWKYTCDFNSYSESR